MKQCLLVIISLLLTLTPAFAEKTMVEITPTKKISTSDKNLTEGNYVDFKIVGTDKQIRGLITKYDENGFAGKEATLTIDHFRAINSDEKYEGTITLKGTEHNAAGTFIEYLADLAIYIRGGEITIIPDKDIFTLWRL